ncbi:MAG TPA: porin [Terriglobia bacterium]|nr:porin [Terriglobia bacterium]
MVVRVLFAVLVLMGTLLSGAALAEDVEISGSFDGYYQFSMNRPADQMIPARSFDFRHSTFSLNYAELVVEKKAEPLGFRADIGFGDASKVVHATEPAIVNGGSSLYQYLQQAYVMAKVNDKVQLDFGKFVTPFGAEVIETKDNWNYTRGLLFNYAVPFYHFGLRANFEYNDKVSYALYVVNGWNNVQDNNSAKSVAASVTMKPSEKFTVIANAMVGKEEPNSLPFANTGFGGGQLSFAAPGTPTRRLLDAVLTYEVNDKLSLMANYDYGTESHMDWKGIAAYGKVKVRDWVTVIPRYEWFQDTDGFVTGTTGQTLQETTLTFQFPVNDNSSVYVEWRSDWNRSTDPAFFHAHGYQSILVPGTIEYDMRHFQNSLLIGWTYSFTKD